MEQLKITKNGGKIPPKHYLKRTLLGFGVNENAAKINDFYNRFSYSQISFSPSLELGFKFYKIKNRGVLK